MLKLVTIAGRVVLGACGFLLVGCAYHDYERGRYDGPDHHRHHRGHYERVDYRYGDRHYHQHAHRHRERYGERYGRWD